MSSAALGTPHLNSCRLIRVALGGLNFELHTQNRGILISNEDDRDTIHTDGT
jgi:hypothetical protein